MGVPTGLVLRLLKLYKFSSEVEGDSLPWKWRRRPNKAPVKQSLQRLYLLHVCVFFIIYNIFCFLKHIRLFCIK